MTKIFNPFEILNEMESKSNSSADSIESTSSLDTGANELGCPKCGATMQSVSLVHGLSAIHCVTCRVTSPKASV